MDKNDILDIEQMNNFFHLKPTEGIEYGGLNEFMSNKKVSTCRSEGLLEEDDLDKSEGGFNLETFERPMDEQRYEQLEYSQCCGSDDDKDLGMDSTVDGFSQKRSIKFDNDKLSLFSGMLRDEQDQDQDQFDQMFELGSSLTLELGER